MTEPQFHQWPLHTCSGLDSPEECEACALEAIAERPQEPLYDWTPLEEQECKLPR